MIPKIPQILALITPSCFWGPLKYLQPVGRRKNYTIWSTKFPITDPKWQTQYWIFISASMTSRIEILSWSGKRDTWKGNIDRRLSSLRGRLYTIDTSLLPKKEKQVPVYVTVECRLIEYHSVWISFSLSSTTFIIWGKNIGSSALFGCNVQWFIKRETV